MATSLPEWERIDSKTERLSLPTCNMYVRWLEHNKVFCASYEVLKNSFFLSSQRCVSIEGRWDDTEDAKKAILDYVVHMLLQDVATAQSLRDHKTPEERERATTHRQRG